MQDYDALNRVIWYDKLGNGKDLNGTALGSVGEGRLKTQALIDRFDVVSEINTGHARYIFFACNAANPVTY